MIMEAFQKSGQGEIQSQSIINIFREQGPLTGAELLEYTNIDPLPVWQACRQTPEICFYCIGKRYVRMDKNVEGYARISPSIRREFRTYTVLGLKDQKAAIEAKARRLRDDIHQISQTKLALSREAMGSITESLAEWQSIREGVCFLIAGDITYDMAHDVPRPEISTGKMVRGSDLDIIVVAEDDIPKAALEALDRAILKKKYFLLVHPNYQEEIDYLVKDIAKVREQLAFDSFPHMIASKILFESMHLHGSVRVFEKVKIMVEEFGIPQKLALLERQAADNRKQAECILLQANSPEVNESILNLFYTREEGDEIY
jgi:hypothetical protein